MNRKAQVPLLMISLAVVVILLAIAFAPAINDVAITASNSSSPTFVGLDCTNASISDFDKANCVAVDAISPYYIGFILFIAGALVAKVVFT